MKRALFFLLLLGLSESHGACFDVWKQTLEQNKEKLTPASRQDPGQGNLLEEIKDTFVGLGESVAGILERSALVPRVRFQERVIRLMERQETPEDIETMRNDYSRRYGNTNRALFKKKLSLLMVDQENLCKKDESVLSENEFYRLLSLIKN